MKKDLRDVRIEFDAEMFSSTSDELWTKFRIKSKIKQT